MDKKVLTNYFRICLIAVALLIAGVVASTIFLFLGSLVSVLLGLEGVLSSFVVLSAASLGYGTIGVFYSDTYSVDVAFSTPSKNDRRTLIAGSVVSLTLGIGLFSLLRRVGVQLSQELSNNGAMIETLPLWVIPLAAVFFIFVSASEEYLFRGVIQTRAENELGTKAGLGVSSVVFALAHFFNYSSGLGRLGGMISIGLVGAVFGVTYTRSNNLLIPIVIHWIYNTTLFVLSILS